MRFIQTGDWHLGRVLYNESLIEDQRHVLESFVALVKESRPDAVVITGDVYDRAIPPEEAVTLLNETLERIVLDHNVPVLMIAGNHDSAARLEFGRRLMHATRFHVAGCFTRDVASWKLEDEHGPVHFYGLPYAEPGLVRATFAGDGAPGEVIHHDSAMQRITHAIRDAHPKGERSVLIAHAFVQGGAISESERMITSVGASGTVHTSHFQGFDYVALGHLHRPQQVGDARVQYAGSLLPYSVSEMKDRKSVTMVELAKDGSVQIERIELNQKRRLREVRGTLEEILAQAEQDVARGDYVVATLLDRTYPLNPFQKIRQLYPRLLHVATPAIDLESGSLSLPSIEQESRSEAELFASFFTQVTGEPMSEEEAACLERIWKNAEARA